MLGGCSESSVAVEPPARAPEVAVTVDVPTPTAPERKRVPAVPELEARQVARALNEFGFRFFKATRAEKNDALSPPTIAAVFGLALPGAKGVTRTELRRAFGVELPDPELLAIYRSILHRDEDGCELDAVNRVFLDESLALEPAYAQVVEDAAGAVLERSPLSRSPEAARERINHLIATDTRERIRELLPAKSLDARTRAVLVSTLTFTGRWVETFKASATSSQPFRLLSGDTVQVPMMSKMSFASFAQVEEAKLLELPYACGDLAMVFILPETGEPTPQLGPTTLGLGGLGRRHPSVEPKPAQPKAIVNVLSPKRALERVEKVINAERLETWLSQLRQRRVFVELPRFSIGAGGGLNGPMQKLGVHRAFTPSADFSGMAREPLWMTHALHQTSIRVDEEGTEAAAGAAIVFGGRGGTFPEAQFIADRPFLFLLRDQRTGTILFLGRVVDPSHGG